MATVLQGTAHKVPEDLKKALLSDPRVLTAWNSLTPLARNEFICWTTFVKKDDVRAEHVRRVAEDMINGKRRPCCWIGCTHRKDKPMSKSQKYILGKK